MNSWNAGFVVVPVGDKLKDLDEKFPQAFPSDFTLQLNFITEETLLESDRNKQHFLEVMCLI